ILFTFFLMNLHTPQSTLFPYTTLFRSGNRSPLSGPPQPIKKILIISYLFPPVGGIGVQRALSMAKYLPACGFQVHVLKATNAGRSEEHTSELQSRSDLVCRLLLEKKKK